MTRTIWFVFGMLAALSLIVLGCGRAKAGNGATATEILGPSGYVCFAISNGDGQVVSGNCLKQ